MFRYCGLTPSLDLVFCHFHYFQLISYIFCHFQVVKGFAFVEFDKPEFATNALKALVVEKSRLRPDMDPAELQSVKTFVAEQEQQIAEKSPKNPVIIRIGRSYKIHSEYTNVMIRYWVFVKRYLTRKQIFDGWYFVRILGSPIKTQYRIDRSTLPFWFKMKYYAWFAKQKNRKHLKR